MLEEGTVFETAVASVPAEIDRGRVSFEQGDACALRADLGAFDAVLCCNLLCRLPDPAALLRRLPDLVAPGGVAVLVSPYSWLAEYTPPERWLGGYRDAAGVRVDSFAAVRRELEGPFRLLEEQDLPFLIREHARKFQWGISHCSVWQRV